MLHSLKTHALLGQLALVCFLTVTLGGAVYQVARGVMERKEGEKIRLLAAGLADTTAGLLKDKQANLRLLIAGQDIERFAETSNYHLLQALFANFRGTFPVIAYVGGQGVREYAMQGQGFSDRPVDLSGDPAVAGALKARGQVVSAVKVAGSDGAPGLTLAVAARSYFGKDLGLIVAESPLAGVTAAVDALRVGETGFAVLADASGRLLSRTPDGGDFVRLPGGEGEAADLLRAGPGFARTTFLGEDSFLAVAPVAGMDWRVVVALPYHTEILGEVDRLRAVVAGIAAALAVLAGGLAFLWARSLARPVTRLAEAVRAVAGGDLSRRVEVGLGGEIGALGAAFNVMTADLERSQARLVAAKGSLESLLAAMNEALLVVEPGGGIRLLNRVGRAMLGYGEAEAANLSVRALFLPDDPLAERLAGGAWPDEPLAGVEKVLVAKDGRRIPALVAVSAVRGGEGEALAVCLAMDLRERKRIEGLAKARDAAVAASRAKNDFLATVSHEIRTPLNVILGVLDHLLDTALTDAQRRGTAMARDAGLTLLDTVNDMLDYIRIEAGELTLARQPLDAGAMMRLAAAPYIGPAKVKGVFLRLDVDPATPPLVVGDAQRLRQVLSKLVDNALKFTEAGEVAVGVCPLRPSGAEEPTKLLFTVADTGIGIADDKIDYVLEPFTQSDASSTRGYGGIGLGLGLVRKLVALMGGSLTLESELGRGTAVYFTVPLALGPAEAGAAVTSRW